MHVQIKHRDLQPRLVGAVLARPLGLHESGGHGSVIENAKASALVGAGVVGATGQVGGQALNCFA